jgi:homoserine dehydrogenase
LHRLASRNGVELHYSAVAGGSSPMIECVRRAAAHGDIRMISGILNGTCNFILDRCHAGLSFDEALIAARARGFAEADPSDDLLGHDAARKLRILSRYAFRHELDGIDVQPLTAGALEKARADARPGQVLRVVARAWRNGAALHADVRLTALDPEDPLASIKDEWNSLLVTQADGSQIRAHGRGAGRWPTTEAVVADLLKLRFDQIDAAIDSAALGDESAFATH